MHSMFCSLYYQNFSGFWVGPEILPRDHRAFLPTECFLYEIKFSLGVLVGVFQPSLHDSVFFSSFNSWEGLAKERSFFFWSSSFILGVYSLNRVDFLIAVIWSPFLCVNVRLFGWALSFVPEDEAVPSEYPVLPVLGSLLGLLSCLTQI